MTEPHVGFRWSRAIPLLLGVAAAAAFIEAGVEQIARADWEQQRAIGQAFLLLLPPWMIRSALALAPFALARRLTGTKLLLHVPAAAICATTHFVLLAAFHRGVLGSGDPFPAIFRDLFRTYFLWDVTIYAAVAGATHALTYFVRLQAARAALAEARLKGLQGQLQPHFLFNVLNSVAMLARAGQTVDVVNVVSDLSQMLRYTLRDAETSCVTLGEEVTFAKRYLSIEHIRFGDRLDVSWEVAADVRDATVPALLLQPLVENVLHHAVARVNRRVGVVVRATRVDQRLRIEVIDDGPGVVRRSAGSTGSHIGLRNLRDRLRQLYGDHFGLIIDGNGGFRVSIELPYGTPMVVDPAAVRNDGRRYARRRTVNA